MDVDKTFSRAAVKLCARASAVGSALGKMLGNVNNRSMIAEKRVGDITVAGALHLLRILAPVNCRFAKDCSHRKRGGNPSYQSLLAAGRACGNVSAPKVHALASVASRTRSAQIDDPVVAERQNHFGVFEKRCCALGQKITCPPIIAVQEGIASERARRMPA